MFLIFLGIVVALTTPSDCGLILRPNNCFAHQPVIYVRPIIHENTTISIIAGVGESVQFECYASGSPGANIQIKWTKPKQIYGYDRNKNSFLLPNGEPSYVGNILKFSSVQPEHAGLYVCSASEEHGLTNMEIYNLSIKSKPIIVKSIIKKNFIEDNVLSTIEIYAESSSNPKGEIKWYKDDQLLTNNDQFTMMTAEHSGTLNVSIKPNSEDYHGIYKFFVENEVGNATHSFKI